MNCDDAIERLPWLLNGTLEEEERRQVQDHLAACERCRTALAETRDAWRIFAGHIPTEDLVAHAWGEPTGTDPELLADHLAGCAQCTAELEMVRTSRQLEEDDRVALFAPRPQSAPAVPPVAHDARGSAGKWRAAALAASLAGLVAAGGWFENAGRLRATEERLAAQEREPAAAPAGELEPLANVPIVELFAITVRGGAEDIPPESPAAHLVLSFGEAPAYDEYAVEFQDASGAVRLSLQESVRSNPVTGEYTVLLPQGNLPPGEYTLVAYGLENGRRTGEPVRFPLTVTGAPAAP
ncbi:MAG TPA: zf-HC2 domain-containing protein [Thermoanaerobaculia bacterium]|nr:zf-HC2 domain-containing protein [Thermoanaerobaculia bacterium]